MQKVFENILETPGWVKGSPAVQEASGLLDDIGLPIIRTVKPAVDARPITMQDAQRLRTAIGDALGDPTILRDISSQNLSRLYAALTADMRQPHVSNGTAQLFDAANAESSRLFRLAEGPFARIVAADTPSAADAAPAKIVTRLLTDAQNGAGDLAAIRAELPDQANRLGALALRQMRDNWRALAPEAQAALVPGTGHRTLIKHSLSSQDEATNAAKAAIEAAKQVRTQAVQEANANASREIDLARQELQRLNKLASHERTVLSVADSQARTEAANALALQRTQPHNWRNLMALGGGAAAISGMLEQALYPSLVLGMSPVKAALIGGAASVAIPAVVGGTKSIVTNPLRLRVPAAAAVAATNASGPATRQEIENALAPGR